MVGLYDGIDGICTWKRFYSPQTPAFNEAEFKKEMVGIKTYLELTNHTKDAKLEYVECEAPTYTDASY